MLKNSPLFFTGRKLRPLGIGTEVPALWLRLWRAGVKTCNYSVRIVDVWPKTRTARRIDGAQKILSPPRELAMVGNVPVLHRGLSLRSSAACGVLEKTCVV